MKENLANYKTSPISKKDVEIHNPTSLTKTNNKRCIYPSIPAISITNIRFAKKTTYFVMKFYFVRITKNNYYI